MAVIAAIAATPACGGQASSPEAGTLLKASGPITQGTVGLLDNRPGNIDGLAFPLLSNTSSKPLEITGFRLTGTPTGMKVIGYSIYSISAKPGYALVYRYKPMDSGAPDLTKFPDYQGQKFVIAPGKTSDRFIMAKVEITGLVKSHVTGCQVKYTQGSQHYVQTLHCEYALDSGSS